MKKIFTTRSAATIMGAVSIAIVSCQQPSTEKTYSASVAMENIKSLNHDDLQFLYDAYNLGIYNQRLATEADIRSTAVESSNLAQSILQSTEKTNQALAEVAAQYKLILPEGMVQQQREAWKDMVKKKGWEFDKTFSMLINQNLRQCHDLFSTAAANCKDPMLKKIAADALNSLQTQGELAIAQEEKIKERTHDDALQDNEEAVITKR